MKTTLSLENILHMLLIAGFLVGFAEFVVAPAERGSRIIYLADGVIFNEIELGPYLGDYRDEKNPDLDRARARHSKLKNFLQDMGW